MSYQEDLYVYLDEKTNQIVRLLPKFCKTYFNHLKIIGKSQRTRLQYAYDLRRFCDYLLDYKMIRKKDFKSSNAKDVLEPITLEDLQNYVNSLEYSKTNSTTKVLSPSTKARKISSLKSFFKYYYKIGAIDKNPADLLESPKVPDKQLTILNRKEISRMLKNISKPTNGLQMLSLRNYAIAMLFFGTGIRLSELIGIDISDINFEKSSILVTRKGGDLDVVYFGPEVKDALKNYIQNGREQLLNSKSDRNALFISKKHRRMSVRAVEEMISSYAKAAGIEGKVSPHALRRSYGTYLYDVTGDIFLVSSALHHASIETTRKHYIRMSDNHKKIAAKKSSGLFTKQ